MSSEAKLMFWSVKANSNKYSVFVSNHHSEGEQTPEPTVLLPAHLTGMLTE